MKVSGYGHTSVALELQEHFPTGREALTRCFLSHLPHKDRDFGALFGKKKNTKELTANKYNLFSPASSV